MIVRRNVVDAHGNHVAASQLAVDCELNSARSRVRRAICSFVRIDQTWLRRSGGFGPISFPLCSMADDAAAFHHEDFLLAAKGKTFTFGAKTSTGAANAER